MDIHDIRTLTLLQAFDKNKHPTQRELAEKLDMSLGMINTYLKGLAKRHLFTIRADAKNRVGYYITHEGILEKTRLHHEYIKYSLGLYTQTKVRIKTILIDLENRDAHTVVFWGANEIAEIAYLSLKDSSIDLIAVIDDGKCGTRFLGHVVISSCLINNIGFDFLLDNTLPTPSGKAALKALPIPEEVIVSVFPDL
jgi:DNA-binding MarR family transcriptional regulator